ncbi:MULTISPECIES: hypothetical protein [Microbacterium]|jgi:hypothetical protein|uniref:hypothetical protein n=1 Tax=Microbacterium TaxID=33882 RepID=UPI001D17A597|nr:hypothetical protein [Microbacterium testaceum]MCC4248992.1 hypothetical protein [Microbacterium testaceum]
MSTSENPENPPLTRRQLRELRNTGATPIITPRLDAPSEDAAPVVAPTSEPSSPPEPEAPEPEAPKPEAPEPEAPEPEVSVADEASSEAEPESAPESPAKKGGMLGGLFGRGRADKPETEPEEASAPVDEQPTASSETAPVTASEPPALPDAFVPADGAGLGVTGLTRRQARAQERIRTASVPIIAPDLQPAAPATRDQTVEGPDGATSAEDAAAPATPAAAVAGEPVSTSAPQPTQDTDAPTAGAPRAIFRPAAPEEAAAPEASPVEETETPVSTVNPALGSDLLNGQTPEISLPPSFDQLISRSAAATGSVSTPNALILSQTPAGVPLVGPVTSTGEVLITGTFELPEGLGSVGHAPGTTDGRDVDAVLLDGELPPASSPTPIAASAAISTVKQPGEIIRPPAPEKGSKLVIGLIITTGALAVAVAVALVLAFTTGVFG